MVSGPQVSLVVQRRSMTLMKNLRVSRIGSAIVGRVAAGVCRRMRTPQCAFGR